MIRRAVWVPGTTKATAPQTRARCQLTDEAIKCQTLLVRYCQGAILGAMRRHRTRSRRRSRRLRLRRARRTTMSWPSSCSRLRRRRLTRPPDCSFHTAFVDATRFHFKRG